MKLLKILVILRREAAAGGILLLAPLALPVQASDAYQLAAVWGRTGSGPAQFREPMGIAVSSQGAVYVADSRNRRVQKLSADGRFLAEFGGPELLKKPVDAGVGPDGTVYVCDYESDRVEIFSQDGRHISGWGGAGGSNGQFRAPAGIAVDKAGQVYVADFYNDRVQVFDAAGRWSRTIGKKGRGRGEFIYPAGLAFDSSGNLFVADAYNHRIQKLDPEGRVLEIWGSPWKRLLGLSGAFRVPSGVAVDGTGNVYVADSANKRVVFLSSKGEPLASWKPADDDHPNVYSPTRIAVGPDGGILAVDTANDRILVLRPGEVPAFQKHEAPAASPPEPASGDLLVRIEGMACPFCAYGIEKHLGRLEGVRSARVNLGEGAAILSLDPGKTVSPEEIRRAVEKAGFTASQVKTILSLKENP